MDIPFPLTALKLKFLVRATSDIRLGGLKAGNFLRGALLNVMSRATCSYTGSAYEHRRVPDPTHVAHCPVCWLIQSNEKPGNERRGYALIPPIHPPLVIHEGEQFSFHITLFGEAIKYLPYFVLAVPEAGKIGMGIGRGTFRLHAILAEQEPFCLPPFGSLYEVMKPGESLVHVPDRYLDHSALKGMAVQWLDEKDGTFLPLKFEFLTPLRLIWQEQLVKTVDFFIFFSRLLERVDMLATRMANAKPRPKEERDQLYTTASKVRIVQNDVKWMEVRSGSVRTGRYTWVSGLVGSIVCMAQPQVWKELLPWLFWGTLTQVGKDVVKGNGVFRIGIKCH
jgi:hypothetical protein